MTNNGLYHYARVISDDEMVELSNLIEKNVSDCYKKITSACFDINPIVNDNVNVGCRYCKYKDICYVKEEDKNKVREDDNE